MARTQHPHQIKAGNHHPVPIPVSKTDHPSTEYQLHQINDSFEKVLKRLMRMTPPNREDQPSLELHEDGETRMMKKPKKPRTQSELRV
jgi:hypothetical protein